MPTANLQRKSFAFSDVEFKADNPGVFRAKIATLNAVDKDGDVSLPGSFPDGKSVVISAYMHTSWAGALPVGMGVIGSDGEKAWVDGEFFLNTTSGKDTYETVKKLAAKGLGEWSYGYNVLDGSIEPEELAAFPGASRIFKQQDVFEASPVLIGAGVNTGTEFVKSIAGDLAAKAEAAFAPAGPLIALIEHLRERKALREQQGRKLSASNRDQLKAAAEVLTDVNEASAAYLAEMEALLASADPAEPVTPAEPEVEAAVDEELLAIWLQQQQREADFAGLLGQA